MANNWFSMAQIIVRNFLQKCMFYLKKNCVLMIGGFGQL